MESQAIQEYISQVDRLYRSGKATEHSYRPALQKLMETCLVGLEVINEPRQVMCGAPDYVLQCKGIPRGYIEAKNTTVALDSEVHGEQLRRYLGALDNLLFTNYLEFRLFREGKEITRVSIAKVEDKTRRIIDLREQWQTFHDMLQSFADYQGQLIDNANDLAARMAIKARMLATAVAKALGQEAGKEELGIEMQNDLQGQFDAFKKYLIHDLTPASFADVYAQTVAYGMFAARLHDSTLETFSRKEAAELIPATNPLLRKFFQHIAGYDLDAGIRWIVNDLADIFRATDVGDLMGEYGKTTQRNDPFLHFYETFLGEYDPALRKGRGVYYTPEPVVEFIVAAVDSILRSEFRLSDGLAHTGKTTIKVREPGAKAEAVREVHKVQILDPATGTGTFLAAIVRYVHEQYFIGQQGSWGGYVEQELMPRLHGFEYLMAPYAMAHIKMDMTLRETHCKTNGKQRLRIFLTNSLEEHHTDTGTMFVQWLAAEAREANLIKRDVPVMVVIGNPPYSGESANKGAWITRQIEDYKQEPGGGSLRERNPKWLNDDYVKFIRCGQYYVDRTGHGILAYINNHSFLDNPTFRGMRWSLLRSFDLIYVLDLHGNAKKKEQAPDGSKDENVFDIQQGVSINLFVKTGKKKKDDPAQVFHADVYGHRQAKYQFLWESNLRNITWNKLRPKAPQYLFVPRDYAVQEEYERGLAVNDLFKEYSVGIVTARDSLTIHPTPQQLLENVSRFLELEDEEARQAFSLGRDVRDWKIALAKKDLKDHVFGQEKEAVAVPIHYRPFDIRYTYYTGQLKGFHCRPRGKVMRHFLEGENVGLLVCRQFKGSTNYQHVFISRHIFESSLVSNKTSEIGYGFPLYLYHGIGEPICNLDLKKAQLIADGLDLRFKPQPGTDSRALTPLDLLDYIYAMLHSPSYRRRYRDFLKTDFPRVPYPKEKRVFRKLVKLGSKLRALHLLQDADLERPVTTYPREGDNRISRGIVDGDYEITKNNKRTGRVWINDEQYFEGVPETAWDFCIGAYQPARKWLKDRRGQTLDYAELRHYQKIITVLHATVGLTHKIDQALGE